MGLHAAFDSSWVLSIFATGLASGCAGHSEQAPSEPPSAEQAAEERCRSICAAASGCGLDPPAQCRSTCILNSQTDVLRTNPEVIQREAECIATTSCDGLDLDLLIAKCFTEVRNEVPPTRASVAFCERMAKPFFECQYFATPVGCSWTTAQLSEAALQSGLECRKTNADCDTLAICLDAKLWLYGSDQSAEEVSE